MSAGVEDDNDLTNLAWLPNVSSIFPLSNEKSPQSSTSATNTTAKRSKSNAKTKESLNSMATSEPKKLLVHQKTNVDELAEKHEKLKAKSDFLRDASAKPPYSYAALICLAMKDTKKKMTLSQVYKWIEENFAYYRSGDKCWQVRAENSRENRNWQIQFFIRIKFAKFINQDFFGVFPNS